MRPREYPAENISPWHKATPASDFNEAAGNTPRKTSWETAQKILEWSNFNEAAGNTPRKTTERVQDVDTARAFNEAAGNTPRKT